jgi:hypothetical protein
MQYNYNIKCLSCENLVLINLNKTYFIIKPIRSRNFIKKHSIFICFLEKRQFLPLTPWRATCYDMTKNIEMTTERFSVLGTENLDF